MAEQTRERLGEYQYSILNLLLKHPEGVHANEVISQLEAILPSTEYEKGSYETGGIRRPKIVRFSTIGLVKAGWLLKENGIWSITAEGRKALVDFPDPNKLREESHRLYQNWKSARVTVSNDSDSDIEDESVALAVSVEDAEATALELVKNYLGVMNPYDFQNLVKALLQGMGYHVSWVAPPGKDGGIDLVAFQDYFGAQGPRIKVQVKRQIASAGVDSIRSFLGVLSDRDDIGLYICLGGFSSDAEKEARNHASKRLTLIDAERFYQLWVEHYDKFPESSRSLFPLKPVYYLDLEN